MNTEQIMQFKLECLIKALQLHQTNKIAPEKVKIEDVIKTAEKMFKFISKID